MLRCGAVGAAGVPVRNVMASFHDGAAKSKEERHDRERSCDISTVDRGDESNIEGDLSDRAQVKAEYERILSSSLDREIAAGVSLFGPHREDIDIRINGISARAFASQGQQRSIVLSLKLAEGEVIKEICGGAFGLPMIVISNEKDLVCRGSKHSEHPAAFAAFMSPQILV